jgi:hypothetical protein
MLLDGDHGDDGAGGDEGDEESDEEDIQGEEEHQNSLFDDLWTQFQTQCAARRQEKEASTGRPVGRWERLPDMHEARDAPVSVADHARARVYTLGGYNASTALASGEYLDYTTKQWVELPPMSRKRCFLGAVCDAEGGVFAVGGGSGPYRGDTCYNTVERLDPVTRLWSEMPSMCDARCGLAAALSPQGDVYAVAGYGGGSCYHSSVERLPFGASQWERVAPLSQGRSGVGAAFGPYGALWTAGGSGNGAHMLSIAERMDPRVGQWERLTDMPSKRGYTCASFGVEGNFWVFGGSSVVTGSQGTVDCYDTRASKWLPRLGAFTTVPRVDSSLALLLPVTMHEHPLSSLVR